MNYPIHFRKMKSGNYELTDAENSTYEIANEQKLRLFFAGLQNSSTTTWDSFNRRFKTAQVVMTRGSQSQSYYRDADHFLKRNSK